MSDQPIASGGTDFIWKLYSGIQKSTKQDVTIFVGISFFFQFLQAYHISKNPKRLPQKKILKQNMGKGKHQRLSKD